MFCCGVAAIWLDRQHISPLSTEGAAALDDLAKKIMPLFSGAVQIVRKQINGIGGYHLKISLPNAHEHRTQADITGIIEASSLDETAKKISCRCFEALAFCEGTIHGIVPEKVHFHEVGALDSILDICLTASLYVELGSPELICGPLPLADGEIVCAHGILPAPAPAVLALLPGMRVKAFPDENAGELLTPTAAALLHALDAGFGSWPDFHITQTALVYGSREFAGVANGVIFAYGYPEIARP